MKVCYWCKGKVVPKQVRHLHQWGERVIIFEDVPAEVCTQCGEVYFGPEALEKMDRFTLSDAEPKATITVPIFSLASVGEGGSEA